MATTGIWKVEKRLDHVIDYVINPEKTTKDGDYQELHKLDGYEKLNYETEEECFVSSLNCSTHRPYKDMMLTKELYGKKSGILGYHAFQSFKEGEITPTQAHLIGVKLAEEIWGDRFEVIVSTHTNCKHIHNHFVINSVSFKDGKKYHDSRETYALIREVSDTLCEEYGLSVVKDKKVKKVNYDNYYQSYSKKTNYHTFAKQDLDRAIGMAVSYKDFINIVEKMGYEIKERYGKLSIRRSPYKRNIRVERAFGEEYSVESIRQRIMANDFIPKQKIIPYKRTTLKFYGRKCVFRKAYKPKGIIALYYYYRFLLGLHQRNNVQHKLTPKMREEVKKMDMYSERIRFLCKYKLETLDNVDELKSKKLREKQDILNTRNRLYYKRGKVDNETERNEITKQIIAVTTELKRVKKEIRMCDEVTDNVPNMKEQIRETEEKSKGKEKQKKKDRRYER